MSQDTSNRASDYRLTTTDGYPAIETPDGDTIVLRIGMDEMSLGDGCRTEIEYDAGSDASWFDIYEAHEGMHDILRVSIQPEVSD